MKQDAGSTKMTDQTSDEAADLQEDAYLLVTVDQHATNLTSFWDALKEPGLGRKIPAIISAYTHHRIGRMLSRYSLQNGKIYAGGISYMAIFSLAAAVTVAWSLFSYFFGSNPGFQTLVVDSINRHIPGLIGDSTTGVKGIIDPQAIVTSSGNFLTGAVALVLAIWSAMKIVRYTVTALRAMFGLMEYPGDAIQTYFRYFVGLLLLFLAIGTTVFLSIISDTFEAWIVTVWPETRRIIETAAFDVLRLLVPSLVDVAMFAVMIRYVARLTVPTKTLWAGAIMYAIASTFLRWGGNALMGASRNPVIATIATVVMLLVWVNILARAALYICAWMADPPATPFKIYPNQVMATEEPNYVTMAAPRTLNWPHNPLSGDVIPAQKMDSNPAQESGDAEQALVAANGEQSEKE